MLAFDVGGATCGVENCDTAIEGTEARLGVKTEGGTGCADPHMKGIGADWWPIEPALLSEEGGLKVIV